MSTLIPRATLTAAIAIYVVAMFLPIGPPDSEGGQYPGYLGFLFAFLSFFSWTNPGSLGPSNALLFFASWLANPLFWNGLYLLAVGYPKGATLAVIGSVCLALPILLLVGGFDLWPGYWLWIGSFGVLATGSAACAASGLRPAMLDSAGFPLLPHPAEDAITASPPRSTTQPDSTQVTADRTD